jgi:hypothetical protein
MTPAAIRARRSVLGEIRASCACRIIHEAGIGQPSRSIVLSQVAARSCLGEGRLGIMGGMGGWGARTGVRIGESSDLTEGMQAAGMLLVATGPVGMAGTVGCSTIRPR